MSEQGYERYEPLPGLLGLPRFLWRRTPRGARIALVAVLGTAVLGTAVAVPLISSGKREGAAKIRREDAAAKARSERRLRIDQTPHRGRAAGAPRAPAAARHAAITTALERAITYDAHARLRAGRLPGPAVQRTLCRTNWRRGTFTWCKTNPPPGEKFGGARHAEVQLTRSCIVPPA